MAWCPKCKYEFREGITVCTDCECELVDDLSLVSDKDFENKETDAVYFVYDDPDDDNEPDSEASAKKNELYVNNEEKADENKSSAFALLSVGIIGLAAIILFFLGIIPSNMSANNKYTITSIMGGMFLLFIVMGFMSIANSKKYEEKAKKENNLTAEIKKWCIDTLNKDDIDSECGIVNIPEEMKYFARVKYVKKMINKQFMNLEDAYVNRIVDEMYAELFE